MKITALVENVSYCELEPWPGLSLYIETEKHRILFDVGENQVLFRNARRRGIDLAGIDTVVISHGHRDHGGALAEFLRLNKTAKVYVQERAFESYYIKKGPLLYRSCLDEGLRDHPQVDLVRDDIIIDSELSLFTVPHPKKCPLPTNHTLYSAAGRDDFRHEQNLVITEEQTVLVTGCGHTGIVNILEKARRWHPTCCVGGFHLYNPTTEETAPAPLLDEIAQELGAYPGMQFHTCHCTGRKAYEYLSKRLEAFHYLSCGESIEVGENMIKPTYIHGGGKS